MLSRLVVSVSVTSCMAAHQAPLSMGFSRQEYWSGLPCPPPGDLPDPGIEPRSCALQADSLPSEPPRKPFLATSKEEDGLRQKAFKASWKIYTKTSTSSYLKFRTSLAVQCLGLQAFKCVSSIPGGETKIPHAMCGRKQ